MLVIAKTKSGYAVIDNLWGIEYKFCAKTQKECVTWCKAIGADYRKVQSLTVNHSI